MPFDNCILECLKDCNPNTCCGQNNNEKNGAKNIVVNYQPQQQDAVNSNETTTAVANNQGDLTVTPQVSIIMENKNQD